MQTIKIESTDPASQGPFVVINVADFNPTVHNPFSQEDEDILRATPVAELNPIIVADVGASLEHRHAELEAEAARQSEQGDILEAERKRLEALAAELKALAAAATPPAPPAQPTDLTAAQMKEQLTARGIDFKANASKADLQALLDTPAA